MKFLTITDDIFSFIAKTLEVIITFLLFTLVFISVASVFFRFVLQSSLFWADEFMRYAMIWMTFMAAPLLVIKEGHLFVDMTSLFFPPKLQKPLFIAGWVCCLIFLIIQFPQAINMSLLNFKQVSSAMTVNMGFIYSCLPISVGLMIAGVTRNIIGYFSYPFKEYKKGGK